MLCRNRPAAGGHDADQMSLVPPPQAAVVVTHEEGGMLLPPITCAPLQSPPVSRQNCTSGLAGIDWAGLQVTDHASWLDQAGLDRLLATDIHGMGGKAEQGVGLGQEPVLCPEEVYMGMAVPQLQAPLDLWHMDQLHP